MWKIVDIFAGPGGLAEGFCSLSQDGKRLFHVSLSIEKENYAFATLYCRAFCRQFPPGKLPDEYYSFVKGNLTAEQMYAAWPEQTAAATEETWQISMGEDNHSAVDDRIRGHISGMRDWILIGGPPCQAYSYAGKVGNRMRKDYQPEKDTRYYLYREYIRLIGMHAPKLFVLENVPGMLSAQLHGQKIIGSVLEGLRNPAEAITEWLKCTINAPRYQLLALDHGLMAEDADPKKFIVKAADFGLPQNRQRIIIIGVREDVDPGNFSAPGHARAATVREVLEGLPEVRSPLSKGKESHAAWKRVFEDMAAGGSWLEEISAMHGSMMADSFLSLLQRMPERVNVSSGSEYLHGNFPPAWNCDWYMDEYLEGVLHHQARPHIGSDFIRYLFASCFADLFGRSPRLPDFPLDFYPAHENAHSKNFDDRFRALLADQPSHTIISHLSKDGHAFIHPDPLQCRSLTPREAARIQTFPENYYFFGGRGAQFKQIGNAVPPYLAKLIAESVVPLLSS